MRTEGRVFEVRPLAGRRWRVTSVGSPSVALFVSERDAVQYAHACAQAFRPCTVRLLEADGRERDAWTYGAFKGIRASGAPASDASSSAA